MNILFCDNPFDRSAVDSDYQDEFNIAKQLGFDIHLFSFEILTQEKDAESATRKIKRSEYLKNIIYRGWMLKPYQYKQLYEALFLKNYQLVNSPIQYQNCHYLPDSYRFISEYTPKTIWLPVANQQVDFQKVFNEITMFGDAPLIIKDFVKSQKHDWDTACFIPSAADKEKVTSIIERFIDLQGADLNEGIVIREFVELTDLAIHSKSGMPLKQEYRLFFLNDELLGCYDYWEEGEYSINIQPPIDSFVKIAKNIDSNFFSMDIAMTKDAKWIIIELGDGQVAGIPQAQEVNIAQFYNQIQKIA